MSDLNRFVATGRLTADATVRTLASGKSVMTMNAAINTGYGEYKKTLFVKVQQWGDNTKNVVEYLKKGTLIGIDGELSRSEWTSQEGKQYVDFVVDVRSVQILSSKKPDTSFAGTDSKPADEDDAVF